MFGDDEKEVVAYLKENCKDGDKVWVNKGWVYVDESDAFKFKPDLPLSWQRPYQEFINWFQRLRFAHPKSRHLKLIRWSLCFSRHVIAVFPMRNLT